MGRYDMAGYRREKCLAGYSDFSDAAEVTFEEQWHRHDDDCEPDCPVDERDNGVWVHLHDDKVHSCCTLKLSLGAAITLGRQLQVNLGLTGRVCACGCGRLITSPRPEARYATGACRVRALRARQDVTS